MRPGHVCSVMGYWEYPPMAEKYKIPIVVTGFEPLDLLDGIRRAVIQLETGDTASRTPMSASCPMTELPGAAVAV